MPSNPIFWPDDLPLPLMSPAGELRSRNRVVRMESKRIRVRRTYSDHHLAVYNFEWNFTSDQFQRFKDFYEQDLSNGQDPFTVVGLDPTDSSLLVTIDYGFFELDYQFSYRNGVYNVLAVVIVESEEVEPVDPPPFVDLCAVSIEPSVSDGSGGGTTFDCYADGDYTNQVFEVRGTDISSILHGQGRYGFQGGETFLTFPTGALFAGSPSVGSRLVLMFYGNGVFGNYGGEDFDDLDVGFYEPGPIEEIDRTIESTFSGDASP